MVASRWNTQTLSCESTATPPTCPVTHLFGNAWDHKGSGSKRGTCCRLAWAFTGLVRKATAQPIVTARAMPAPTTHFVLAMFFIRHPLYHGGRGGHGGSTCESTILNVPLK